MGEVEKCSWACFSKFQWWWSKHQVQTKGQDWGFTLTSLGAFFRLSGGYSRKYGQVRPESEPAW